MTTTFTAPAAWAGVVAVILVLLDTVTAVAAVPPRLTVAPLRNPVPVIVTTVPPLAVPDVGEIELTVGAGFPPPEPCPLALNVAICIIQVEEATVPVVL